MPSAAAAAADKTANADAGPSPPKKQDTGKGRGRALQLSVKTSVRRRGVARYDSTVALSGNAVNFEPPLGYDDSYAYSREPLKISDGETLHVIYRRVACPVFPALPAAVDNATQRLHPRHITKKVFKYIFEVAGTDTDSGEILHQVMAACRAHCLHNSIFSDAALIEEANLHLRAAGACRVKTHFSIESNSFPDAHHVLSQYTGVLRAECEELQAERDRADIASGGTRSRNQTAVRSDLDSVIWAAHGRGSAAWA